MSFFYGTQTETKGGGGKKREKTTGTNKEKETSDLPTVVWMHRCGGGGLAPATAATPPLPGAPACFTPVSSFPFHTGHI